MGVTVSWFKYLNIQLAFQKTAFEFFQYIG
jgi:hypothetical protein